MTHVYAMLIMLATVVIDILHYLLIRFHSYSNSDHKNPNNKPSPMAKLADNTSQPT